MRNRWRPPSAASAFTAARRPDAITAAPAAVLITAGFINAPDIADADVTVIAPDNAGGERYQRQQS
jgi:hypothetical protein